MPIIDLILAELLKLIPKLHFVDTVGLFLISRVSFDE